MQSDCLSQTSRNPCESQASVLHAPSVPRPQAGPDWASPTAGANPCVAGRLVLVLYVQYSTCKGVLTVLSHTKCLAPPSGSRNYFNLQPPPRSRRGAMSRSEWVAGPLSEITQNGIWGRCATVAYRCTIVHLGLWASLVAHPLAGLTGGRGQHCEHIPSSGRLQPRLMDRLPNHCRPFQPAFALRASDSAASALCDVIIRDFIHY